MTDQDPKPKIAQDEGDLKVLRSKHIHVAKLIMPIERKMVLVNKMNITVMVKAHY